MHKTKFLLTLLLLGCLLQLSCGRDLSRRTAAKLITEKYGYPYPVTKMIGLVDSQYFGDQPDFFQSDPELSKYLAAGLIRIESLKVSSSEARARGFIGNYPTVKLTPEGSRYLMPQQNNIVRLCTALFVEVTGIAFSGDKSEARVEFNSRCSDVTPFGKIDGVDEAKLESHQVEMQLYDDGWRL